MREGGTFPTLERKLKILVENARDLVELEDYRHRLVRCLLEPYDWKALAEFLILDNICRTLRDVMGERDTATLWEARKQAFEEAWQAVEAAVSLDEKVDWVARSTHNDRGRLRDVLSNALSKRTVDAVHEHIERGMK